MPAYAGRDPDLPPPKLAVALADDGTHDVFAEEQLAKQAQLDALVDSLAEPQLLLIEGVEGTPDALAKPTDVEALQSFLASDAAQQDKLEQLITFLADGPAGQPVHDELAAETDIFAEEQEQKQKALDELVDSLANGTAALLATDAGDVASVHEQASVLNLIGGAVLLLVAVALVVMTKRSTSKIAKHKKEEETQSDFGYTVMFE